MSNLVAKKYVKALLEIDGLSMDDVSENISAIAEAIKSNPQIVEFLDSPLIKNSDKYKAVVEPLADKLDTKVVSLLKLMSDKGRLSLLPDFADELQKEIQQKSKQFNGVVCSAEEIDSALIKKLEKKLSSFAGADVKLEYQKSDIDGIRAEVADLGLELNFSKERVKNALIEHIQKAL